MDRNRPAKNESAGAPTPLAALLTSIAAGVYPPPDGQVTVLPQPSPRDAGVFVLTAHTVIFADVDPAWVMRQLPADDLSAPLNPPFLAELACLTARRVNSIDMLCFAPALPGPPPTSLVAAPASSHPRAARARRYRDGVHAWETDGGLVILGRGVAGRWEVAVEVDPERRGAGLGRRLAAAARHLIPPGEPLWAQIAPGNAASVRAFLAAGYVPAAAEALLVRT
ncbi:MAG TPA: GNAT family N-acetyltransferase [Streptosporangiaceae bacterium]